MALTLANLSPVSNAEKKASKLIESFTPFLRTIGGTSLMNLKLESIEKSLPDKLLKLKATIETESIKLESLIEKTILLLLGPRPTAKAVSYTHLTLPTSDLV